MPGKSDREAPAVEKKSSKCVFAREKPKAVSPSSEEAEVERRYCEGKIYGVSDGEGEVDEAEGKYRVAKCLEEPTTQEVMEHNARGHPSVRSRRPHCVRGAGQSMERGKEEEDEARILKYVLIIWLWQLPKMERRANHARW